MNSFHTALINFFVRPVSKALTGFLRAHTLEILMRVSIDKDWPKRIKKEIHRFDEE